VTEPADGDGAVVEGGEVVEARCGGVGMDAADFDVCVQDGDVASRLSVSPPVRVASMRPILGAPRAASSLAGPVDAEDPAGEDVAVGDAVAGQAGALQKRVRGGEGAGDVLKERHGACLGAPV
jgi:hypothetical protein